MSPFEQKFPFHHFLFSTQDEPTDQLPPFILPQVDHLFLIGPCSFEILNALTRVIQDKPQVRIFWLTNQGDVKQCCLHMQLFAHPYLYLFDFEDPEHIAFKAAALGVNLNFDVVVLCEKTAQLDSLCQVLIDKFVLFFYLRQEVLALPFIVEHIFKNFQTASSWKQIQSGQGAFKGLPLLLLGAGPSLDQLLPFLKQEQTHLYLMAAGSSMAVLHDSGIGCDFGCMVCPNDEAKNRLKGKLSAQVMVTAPRCTSELFLNFSGSKIVLPMLCSLGLDHLRDLMGSCPILSSMPEHSSTALSLALATAIYLGFDPIILGGVDLAYHDKQYAGGLSSSWEPQRFLPELGALADLIKTSSSSIYQVGSLQPLAKSLQIDDLNRFLVKTKMSQQEIEGVFQKTHPCFDDYFDKLSASFARCQSLWDHPFKEVMLEHELAYQELLKHVEHPDLLAPLFFKVLPSAS